MRLQASMYSWICTNDCMPTGSATPDCTAPDCTALHPTGCGCDRRLLGQVALTDGWTRGLSCARAASGANRAGLREGMWGMHMREGCVGVGQRQETHLGGGAEGAGTAEGLVGHASGELFFAAADDARACNFASMVPAPRSRRRRRRQTKGETPSRTRSSRTQGPRTPAIDARTPKGEETDGTGRHVFLGRAWQALARELSGGREFSLVCRDRVAVKSVPTDLHGPRT